MELQTTIHEISDEARSIELRISQGPYGLYIGVSDHGDYCSEYGQGHFLGLEYDEGKLRLLVWTDINQEDPTHSIDLSGAKEQKRINP